MDSKTVRRVATLARLRVGEDEAAKVATEMQSILGFVDQLSKVDVEGVEAMTTPAAGATPLRADEVRADVGRDEVLSNAPKTQEGFFIVPKVVE